METFLRGHLLKRSFDYLRAFICVPTVAHPPSELRPHFADRAFQRRAH